MRIISRLAGMAVVLFAGAEAKAATQWNPYNTCWQDFDVGGNWFCGIRHSTCSGAGQLWCTNSTDGLNTAQPTAAPLSKKVALDSDGWAWVWTNDNKLRYEATNGSFVLFSPTIPATCVSKFVVAGSAGNNPRLLVLACNGTLYRYLDGAWFVHPTSGISVVDLAVSSGGTFSFLGSDHRIRFAGPGGGGSFVVLGKDTRVTETWSGGSALHTTTRIAGYLTGIFGSDLLSCNNPINGFGTAWAYSFSSNQFLVGDPRDCDHLQPLPQDVAYGSPPHILKAVGGGRGPGNDILWILTNQARVSALVSL